MAKRLATIWLILLFAAAGCSSGPSEATDPTSPSAAPITDKAPLAPSTPRAQQDPSGGHAELVVLFEEGNSRRAVLDQVVWEFEAKYPHIRVHVQEVPIGDLVRDEDPSMLDGYDVAVTQGYLPRLHRPSLNDLTVLNLPPLDAVVAELMGESQEGQLLWTPVQVGTRVVKLHKEILTHHGIEIPGINWTYAEFESLIRRLQEAGIHQPIPLSHLKDSFMMGFGARFYDPGQNRFTFDSAANRAALTYFKRLLDDGILTLDLSFHAKTYGADASPVILAQTGEEQNMYSNYVTLPYPVGPAGRVTSLWYPLGVSIMKTTNQPEAAATFVHELLLSTAFAEAGMHPTVENPRALAVWEERSGADLRVYSEVWYSMRAYPPEPAVLRYGDDIDRYFAGEVLLDDLLTDLDIRVNAALMQR